MVCTTRHQITSVASVGESALNILDGQQGSENKKCERMRSMHVYLVNSTEACQELTIDLGGWTKPRNSKPSCDIMPFLNGHGGYRKCLHKVNFDNIPCWSICLICKGEEDAKHGHALCTSMRSKSPCGGKGPSAQTIYWGSSFQHYLYMFVSKRALI